MSIKYLARFSIPIIFFCSNTFADTTLTPAAYDHCFQEPSYLDQNSTHEEALSIGECFYLAAENILLDGKNRQHEAPSSRSHSITAFQYADSWFRLSIQKGSSVAITFLHHTELYLLEDSHATRY